MKHLKFTGGGRISVPVRDIIASPKVQDHVRRVREELLMENRMKSDKGDLVTPRCNALAIKPVTISALAWMELAFALEQELAALAAVRESEGEERRTDEQPRMNYAATMRYAEEVGLPTDFTDPAFSEALKRDAETIIAAAKWAVHDACIPCDTPELNLERRSIIMIEVEKAIRAAMQAPGTKEPPK